MRLFGVADARIRLFGCRANACMPAALPRWAAKMRSWQPTCESDWHVQQESGVFHLFWDFFYYPKHSKLHKHPPKINIYIIKYLFFMYTIFFSFYYMYLHYLEMGFGLYLLCERMIHIFFVQSIVGLRNRLFKIYIGGWMEFQLLCDLYKVPSNIWYRERRLIKDTIWIIKNK